MTFEALNGSLCLNNREIVLTEPSTVAFNCAYESPPPSRTIYSWSMDGKPLPELTTNMAMIHISSGSHYVTCEAYTDISSTSEAGNCTCTDSRSVNVTVIGKSMVIH